MNGFENQTEIVISDISYFQDLRMFHPKEMQCDRRDEGDEQCKLTEEPLEKKKICSKVTPPLK